MRTSFKLVDVFATFQGEGAHWGRRALFLRLPFCNLKCSFCDTEFNSYKKYSEEMLIEKFFEEKCRFAVLTGGEPTMNTQLPDIIKLLKFNNFEIAIETNGCFPIPEGVDFVTVSPKRDSLYGVHEDAAFKCNELKVVVDEGFDFSVLHKLKAKVNKYAKLTLSPEWGNLQTSFQKIEAFIKEYPEWRYSLQSHKILNLK